MVYRPVRERSLPVLQRLIGQGLDSTGFEELSFLSLSTGDFSMLETLFTQSFSRCLNEQVAVALPSLRVGSVSEQMMELIARIRRTGATLAPEAGSQRLRDVINKGISEEDLLRHTGQLFAHGWKSVKLYFMIGLPTETEDDLEAIFDLCRKVRQSAGAKSRQVQITAAISPFVPKPHTPFQWERQLSLAETRERILCLRDLFKRHKGYRLNWRKPEMSLLEGVFSRGDQSLAKCIERAYQAGDILTSWYEYFDWSLWSKVFAEFGLEPEAYLQGRDEGASLPWGHIKTGVSKGFLSRERTKALEGRASPDCRYGPCLVCGVCNLKGQASTLDSQAQDKDIRPRINQGAREAVLPGQRWTEKDLQTKAQHLRVWYTKLGLARFFSQLELQRIFGRALRRAGLALSFSGGFHPLPRISFGPALPVGVQSLQEWFDVFLRESVQPSQVLERLGPEFPQGLGLSRVQVLDLGKRQPQAIFEEFALEFFGSSSQVDTWRQGLLTALDRSRIVWERPTKAGNKKSEDVRPYFAAAKEMDQNRIWLRFDWQTGYRSPLKLVCLLLPGLTADQFMLTKLRQIMDCQDQRHEVACP
jgi:radical SAM-linked protein